MSGLVLIPLLVIIINIVTVRNTHFTLDCLISGSTKITIEGLSLGRATASGQ